MGLKKVELMVSEDSYEFVSASIALGMVIKKQLDDGFQLDKDLAALLPALIVFGGDVSKVGKMDDDFAADPAATVLAVLAAAAPLAEMLKKSVVSA